MARRIFWKSVLPKRSCWTRLPAPLPEMLANARRAAGSASYARASTRSPNVSVEVLSHVVQGRLNKQIAWDLGIHERTVKLHRTAITTKLNVQSVAELTRLTQEAGIFPEPVKTLFPKGE